MAERGEVLERFLEPRWGTVVGTLREWASVEYMSNPMSGSASSGDAAFTAVLVASGPGAGANRATRPTEVEQWKHLWVRGDGRCRIEHRSPGSDAPFLTEIRDGGSSHAIRPDGTVMRGELELRHLPTWLLDPGSLLGLVRLTFGAEDVFAGRRVIHASATMRGELPPMVSSAGPMLFGMPFGGRSELTIDVETGILVRFATFEGNRLIGLRQFVDLAIDLPVDDELVTFHLEPGQRVRTHRDDMLDMLRAEGEDVSHIDPEDEQAVQEAMRSYHERRRPPGLEGRSGSSMHRSRRLGELVRPRGNPPTDPDRARALIADAVAGLSPADTAPRSQWIERGDLLDEAFARSRELSAPMTGGRPVTMALVDVMFLREDEALIEFTIHFGPSEFRRQGRAVLEGERWLVSYDTAASLLELGGVAAPSLLDEPEEEA